MKPEDYEDFCKTIDAMVLTLRVDPFGEQEKAIYFKSLKSLSKKQFSYVSQQLCESFKPKRRNDFPPISDFLNVSRNTPQSHEVWLCCPCEACKVTFLANSPGKPCECDLTPFQRMGPITFPVGECFRCYRCKVHCTCDEMLTFLESDVGKQIRSGVGSVFNAKDIFQEPSEPEELPF